MNARHSRLARSAAVVVLIVLAAALVPSLSSFYVSSAGTMLVYAIAALGASLVIQHTNLPSIGHGVFFGIGGYAFGLLTVHGITGGLASILLAVVTAGSAAALVGPVVLRTRAAYFMMITLAISQLLSGLASSLTSFTGGDNGLSGVPDTKIVSLDLADPTTFYFVCLALVVVGAAVLALLIDSPYGYALRSLKGDDRRARSLGVSPLAVRLAAFVVSGAVCGLAGALFTLNSGFVDPSSLSATTSGAIFLMVAVAGGRLGVLGPVLGAVIVQGILTIVASHTNHSQLVLGCVAVLAALFLIPSGPRAGVIAPGAGESEERMLAAPQPALSIMGSDGEH